MRGYLDFIGTSSFAFYGNIRDWINDTEKVGELIGWDEYQTVQRVLQYLSEEASEFKEFSGRKHSNFATDLFYSFPSKSIL